MNSQDLLSEHPNFASLDPKIRAQLNPLLELRSYEAGEYLVRAGEPALYLIWLFSGVCREFYVTHEGNEYNKAFVVAGQVAGSLYDLKLETRSTAYIEFLQPTCGAVMLFSDFTSLVEKDRLIRAIYYRMVEQLFLKKCKREHDLLTLNATERYLSFCSQYPGIDQMVPLYHIASYLGISPEALSRIRRKLALVDKDLP